MQVAEADGGAFSSSSQYVTVVYLFQAPTVVRLVVESPLVGHMQGLSLYLAPHGESCTLMALCARIIVGNRAPFWHVRFLVHLLFPSQHFQLRADRQF